VNEDVPDGSLGPSRTQIEEMVAPPYRAAAREDEGDMWTRWPRASDRRAAGVASDELELTVVGGERTLTVGDEQTTSRCPRSTRSRGQGDVAIHAERVDGDTFSVDVFPL
jgi:hypothetical protein